MALAFAKRKKLYCEVDWQGDRRQGSDLSPGPRAQGEMRGVWAPAFPGQQTLRS